MADATTGTSILALQGGGLVHLVLVCVHIGFGVDVFCHSALLGTSSSSFIYIYITICSWIYISLMQLSKEEPLGWALQAYHISVSYRSHRT